MFFELMFFERVNSRSNILLGAKQGGTEGGEGTMIGTMVSVETYLGQVVAWSGIGGVQRESIGMVGKARRKMDQA